MTALQKESAELLNIDAQDMRNDVEVAGGEEEDQDDELDDSLAATPDAEPEVWKTAEDGTTIIVGDDEITGMETAESWQSSVRQWVGDADSDIKNSELQCPKVSGPPANFEQRDY